MTTKPVLLYLGYGVFGHLTGFLGGFVSYLTGSSWLTKEVTLFYITLHLFDKHMLSHSSPNEHQKNKTKKTSMLLLAHSSVSNRSHMIASARERGKRCWFFFFFNSLTGVLISLQVFILIRWMEAEIDEQKPYNISSNHGIL